MGKDYLLDLMRSKKTVFTFKDVVLIWGESDLNFVKKKIYRYTNAKKIFRIRKGIYSKDKTYDKYELATKIFIPSYISLETVLGASGITFQFYDQIFIASYQTRDIECNDQKYSFKKIKDEILTNQIGIEKRENYSIASTERAFLDVIYLHKEYHFDNLLPLNWAKIYDILSIYGGNKAMAKRVDKYHEAFKQNLK